ncbi:hypothetical protein M413DRAFT_151068 [Hebeloma cylindrosporum]|uniref:Uncharacterized protein n=1 Tax=Hebeloma cylindrosporum TaxID=76867 RepID=A0A0C3CD77_HEBCY|nr:hypothetical protein M413DRAFT_151068 [Hebeloma cylindrosporum h7]
MGHQLYEPNVLTRLGRRRGPTLRRAPGRVLCARQAQTRFLGPKAVVRWTSNSLLIFTARPVSGPTNARRSHTYSSKLGHSWAHHQVSLSRLL